MSLKSFLPNIGIIILTFFMIACISDSSGSDDVNHSALCLGNGYPVPGENPLAADDASNKYRTGEIDPAVLHVPADIASGINSDPESYAPKLVAYFLDGSDSDFHTIKRFHDWITLHIAYDNDYFYGKGGGAHDPVSVLTDGKTTCGGFAKLLGYFCTFAKIETVLIDGISRSSYNALTKEMSRHTWLAAKIECLWYIVDATHDSRFSYNDGVFSNKSEYRDTNLFISPKAEILHNYPDKDTYQFLDTKVSKEAFLAFPQVGLNYVKYRAELDTDVSALITKEKTQDKADHLFVINDIIETNDVVIIKVKVPENVALYAKLLKSNSAYYDDYAFQYRDGKYIVCQFAAPPAGDYAAYISARYLDAYEKYAQKLYEFTIRSTGTGKATLPRPAALYELPENAHYGVIKVTSNMTIPPYFLTITYKTQFNVFSGIYIPSAEGVKQSASVTEISANNSTKTVRFDFPDYAANEYFIKVKVKNVGDTYYNDTVMIARIIILKRK